MGTKDFSSRSRQSIRRVGPDSSRTRKVLEEVAPFSQKAADILAVQFANEKLSESGVDSPLQQKARDNFKQALAVGEQVAMQGDFDPANAIAPVKMQNFGANLPFDQRIDLINRFAPQARQQRVNNLKEHKLFFDLKEAQRKAKVFQEADAVKIQVQQRLANIDPLAKPQEQLDSMVDIITKSPEALGDPRLAQSIKFKWDDTFNRVNKAESRKYARKQTELNLALAAAKAGDKNLVLSIFKKGKQGQEGLSKLGQTAVGLAEATQSKQQSEALGKTNESILNELEQSGTTYDQLLTIEPMISGTLDGSQKFRFDIIKKLKEKKANGEIVDDKINELQVRSTSLASIPKEAVNETIIKSFLDVLFDAFQTSQVGGAKNIVSLFPNDFNFMEITNKDVALTEEDLRKKITNSIYVSDPEQAVANYKTFTNVIQQLLLNKQDDETLEQKVNRYKGKIPE
tara:strand:+ start:3034 stop:4404 length:1371 start_codon:yes stop_codon:yes gene_type:complete